MVWFLYIGKHKSIWLIIHNCEPECMFLDLLTQGLHHERTKTFYLRPSNTQIIGKLSFENRLNDILCLLGDKWLDQSQVTVKKMLNEIIKQKIPAKCV